MQQQQQQQQLPTAPGIIRAHITNARIQHKSELPSDTEIRLCGCVKSQSFFSWYKNNLYLSGPICLEELTVYWSFKSRVLSKMSRPDELSQMS
jgi:hypothetical protein